MVKYVERSQSHDLEIDILDALDKKIQKNEQKYPIEKSKGNAKKWTELEKQRV